MANAPTLQYGPDTGRGPFTSVEVETASLQLATILAQMRAPKGRLDADVQSHADFIRNLADRLCPDFAAQLSIEVFAESANTVHVIITAPTGTYSLIDVWLADAIGGGLTGTAATTVTFNLGTILQTVVDKKHYRVLTTVAGVIDITLGYASAHDWYLGITRYGRVWYSDQVHFT